SSQLGVMLASQTSSYMMAAWKALGATKGDIEKVAAERRLELETLRNWINYLGNPKKDHPYLKPWNDGLEGRATEVEIRKIAAEFQSLVLSVIAEKKEADGENRVLL